MQPGPSTWRPLAVLSLALALVGCAVSVHNPPSNVPLSPGAPPPGPARNIVGANLVALSFSGGGLRAAAFSFGVMQALQAASAPGQDLLDDITMISSVSGGSLTAAYYGLHGPAGLGRFRDKVLLQDMESSMRLSALAPENFVRLLSGGLNDRANLVNWLDQHVFEGATFAKLYTRRKPDIWINASDLYHRTPFAFIPPLFNALCSDLSQFSLAEAVSASMAVPLVFSPIVLKTYPEHCPAGHDAWVERALADPGASKAVHASAQAMKGYRDPTRMRYVKLVDGGVTDNYGLTGLLVGRAVSRTSYGPFTPRDAVTLQRMLFLVVDAGRGPSGDWALSPDGPSGIDAALAATDSAIDSAARVGFDAFRHMMQAWQASTIHFRCSLSSAEVARLRGSAEGWDCRDLQFHLGLVSFADLGGQREAALNRIPTRLTLPAQSIDDAIAAGFEAARGNPSLKTYLTQRVNAGPPAAQP